MTKNENASIAEPEVVIFNDGLLKKSLNKSGSSITEWKSFMSHKISKVNENPQKSLSKNIVRSDEEINRKNDEELEELLKTTKLLEKYTTEQLSGKDRRKYVEQKVVELGAKPKKGVKIPTPISLEIQSKRQERERKELEEAKNLGLYHKSIKHKWASSSSSLSKSQKVRDKGIGMGIGKIKNGMLVLSSKDIKHVQNSRNGSNSGKLKKHGGDIKKKKFLSKKRK
ncbi:hypothetical protein RhiirA5_506044 [Rhizophagus irregularis]|uniref:Uncharacterized protein n=2 Tax=Rhizophagus irregularis TaxID=588596 RepID=A0A2I1E0T3_9GLOM|eukprot:XP_025182646.1 hypothetical protein GLOIN_2v1562359 [Rhizophagus irregularis DAOM 181602=DAOM 197198]